MNLLQIWDGKREFKPLAIGQLFNNSNLKGGLLVGYPSSEDSRRSLEKIDRSDEDMQPNVCLGNEIISPTRSDSSGLRILVEMTDSVIAFRDKFCIQQYKLNIQF